MGRRGVERTNLGPVGPTELLRINHQSGGGGGAVTVHRGGPSPASGFELV